MPMTTSRNTSRSLGVRVSSLDTEDLHFPLLLPQAAVLFDSPGNRVQEFPVFKGFLQEIRSSGFKGPDARGNRTVAGDENDGKRDTLIGQAVLEFETAQFRHLDVKNEAPRRIRVAEIQEFKG